MYSMALKTDPERLMFCSQQANGEKETSFRPFPPLFAVLRIFPRFPPLSAFLHAACEGLHCAGGDASSPALVSVPVTLAANTRAPVPLPAAVVIVEPVEAWTHEQQQTTETARCLQPHPNHFATSDLFLQRVHRNPRTSGVFNYGHMPTGRDYHSRALTWYNLARAHSLSRSLSLSLSLSPSLSPSPSPSRARSLSLSAARDTSIRPRFVHAPGPDQHQPLEGYNPAKGRP